MAVFLHICFLTCVLVVCAAGNTNVSTESGTYLGKEGVSLNGKSYHAFLGVRFARAERFSRPEQEKPIAGIYNATFSRDGCIQVMVFEDGRVEGKEDCLFLDIYAPVNHSKDSPKSVMVWIHGGGLVTGKAEQFDGSNIATQGDVVVVCIQYRLGPLGFLSTEDELLPGNYGMWDQLTALKWIKDNILYFGGDPQNVTIFGESAGGCSVNLLLVSRKSKGLFKRVITQSPVLCFKENQLPTTYALAKLVNCYPVQSSSISRKTLHTNIVDCLKHTDATTLTSASYPLDDEMKSGLLDFIYTATVDGEFLSKGFYDLLSDKDYLATTSYSDVDLMVSVNNNEGLGIYFIARRFDRIFNTSEAKPFQLLSQFRTYLITPYLKRRYGIVSSELLDTITFESIYPLNLSTEHIETESGIKLSSQIFISTASHFVRTHSNYNGQGSTYLYLFDHDQQLTQSFSGMIHGMDLVYTFGFAEFQLKAFLGTANITIPPSEKEISTFLISFLTGFAKTGNPSSSVSDMIPGGWPGFDQTAESYLSLSSISSIKQHPYPRVTAFWGDLVPRLVSAALNRSEPVTAGCQVTEGSTNAVYSIFVSLLFIALTGEL